MHLVETSGSTSFRAQDAPGSVFVVGAQSALGNGLAQAYVTTGTTVWRSSRRQGRAGGHELFLDLSGPADSWELPSPAAEVAFLCAAVTSQQQCESLPDATYDINVSQTLALARRLLEAGTFVVFLSSSLVLDGQTPYSRSDQGVNPQTAYGRQKSVAEEQLLALGDKVAIVRLGKVVLPGLALFDGWAADLRAGKTIHPFSDMVLAPLSLSFAVELLRRVAATRSTGITQASAAREISYAQAAQCIAHLIGADPALVIPVLRPPGGNFFSPRHATLDARELGRLHLEAPEPEAAFLHFSTTGRLSDEGS